MVRQGGFWRKAFLTINSVPSLKLEAIFKAYGSQEVLRGFDGVFEPGRIAALVGPNGAGKTTLMRIAAGLQFPDSGKVHRGRVLYCGGSELLPIRGKVRELRHALGLSSGVEGARRLSALSRGELQRVALDLAFEIDCDALLLDEPWNALEPDARDALNERLRVAVQQRVIICSSHDLDQVARVADDVIFLAGGIGIWKRREDGVASRDELVRIYRQTKMP